MSKRSAILEKDVAQPDPTTLSGKADQGYARISAESPAFLIWTFGHNSRGNPDSYFSALDLLIDGGK